MQPELARPFAITEDTPLTLIRFSRETILVAALAIGLLAGAPALVHAQGITAKPGAQAPAANAELLKLRRELAELEKRVVELEKPEVEEADDPEEASREEARNNAVERRLAALEKSAATGAAKKDAPATDDGDGDELKRQLAAANTDIASLKGEVAKLKARDPAKPAEGQPLTVRAPFAVKDAAGRIVFQVDVPADGNLPRAIVGNPAGAHVAMGPSPGGSAAFALYDDANSLVVAMVGGPQRSYLRIRDNEQSASLGNIEKIGTGLFLRKGNEQVADVSADTAGAGTVRIYGAGGGKVTASLSSIPAGGTVKTFNSDQKAVAALFGGSDGGHVALTGPMGGPSAVQLSVTPSGGKVRVFAAEGGKARAELIAAGEHGAMTIFNSSGTSAAMMESSQSGSGHLVILNAAGENAVEAGVMSGNVGIVRTGPAGSGPAGSLGGALFPASSIQGKKGGK
jgi:hypothetical protein